MASPVLTEDKLPTKERTIDAIQLLIAEGEIRPPHHYSQEDLAEIIDREFDFKPSRTPVLQAVSVLGHDGLLDQKKKVGASLVELSRDEFDVILGLRKALEVSVAEKLAADVKSRAVLAVTDDGAPAESTPALPLRSMDAIARTLTAADASIQSGSKRDFLKASRRFHRLIAETAGMRSVCAMVESLWTQCAALYVQGVLRERNEAVIRRDDMPDILAEHRAIFEAINGGRRNAARERVLQHLDAARKRIGDVPFDRAAA